MIKEVIDTTRIKEPQMKTLAFTLLLNSSMYLLIPTLQKYFFYDFSFLPWLLLVMALDLITGISKTVHLSGWSGVTSYGIRGTVSKVIQYSVFLILLNVLVSFEVEGKVVMGELKWVTQIGQQFLIFIEAKSIKENLDIINPSFLNFKVLVKRVFPFLYKENKTDKND